VPVEQPLRRVLVAIAPVPVPGRLKPDAVPCRVGVSFWRGEGRQIATILVRATAPFKSQGGTAGTGFLEPRQFGLPIDTERLNDWVPTKPACDIVVTGHVEVPAGPSGVLPVHGVVRAPGASVAFTVTSGAPGRAPLKAPYLAIAGEGINDLGPNKKQLDPAVEQHYLAPGFDYTQFQGAHPRLQSAGIPNGAHIVIQGLGGDASDLTIELPKLGARALIDWARDSTLTDANLKLDTIHIDLDAELVDLVWRGYSALPASPRTSIDRILVGFARDEDLPDAPEMSAANRYGEMLRELPRGRFSYAWEREDVAAGKEPPPLPPEELEMCRYEALGNADAPSPTLTLGEHAQISAELLEIVAGGDVETREARAEVLEAHHLDEFQWSIEERAHADRLASVPSDTESGVHVEYAKLFVEAQERLAPPGETLPSARDYAAIATRLEIEQPRTALADMKMSLGAWMRIDRAWQRKIIDDEQAAAEVEEWLEKENAERGDPAIPEVDDEGRFL